MAVRYDVRGMVTGEHARVLLERERLSLAAHRDKLRGSAFPPPGASHATFLHGFLLPFSLLVALLRQRELGAAYLRLVITRSIAVAAASAFVFGLGETRAPALHRGESLFAHGFAWLAWFVGVLSFLEGALAFLSRHHDDHLAAYLAPLARIRPERWPPPPPRLSLGLRDLATKGVRIVRGYVILASGLPLLVLLKLVPVAGPALFSVAFFTWGAYWFALFGAAKSQHAFADEGRAPPPAFVRRLTGAPTGALLAPLRAYGRLCGRVTRRLHAPAAVFEARPAAFFGLALARVVLALPGLYNLSRPVISVAAGRLCAEADPAQRFSL